MKTPATERQPVSPVALRLDPAVKDAMIARARETGVSFSALACVYLREATRAMERPNVKQPTGARVPVCLRLPEATHAMLKALAAKTGRSVSQIIEITLRTTVARPHKI